MSFLFFATYAFFFFIIFYVIAIITYGYLSVLLTICRLRLFLFYLYYYVCAFGSCFSLFFIFVYRVVILGLPI